MEELKCIHKYQGLSENMKQIRRRFNSRRYATLPTQSSPPQSMDKVAFQSCLTHRLASHNNNQAQSASQKLRNSTGNLNSTIYVKSYLDCTERFSLCSSKSKNKSKQKVPNFWETQIHMPNVKPCKMDCSGYSKRKLRLKQHNYIYNKLFTDSSTVGKSKMGLSKNVKIMSRALMGNLVMNKFNYQQSDQMLMLNKKQLKQVLQNKQNRRSEGY